MKSMAPSKPLTYRTRMLTAAGSDGRLLNKTAKRKKKRNSHRRKDRE